MRTTRSPVELESMVLRFRSELRETSILGEYGARAIRDALREQANLPWPVPSVRTIGRILERHGALDQRRRRVAAPPPGWYLPDLREWETELDSFDTIEGLRLHGGPDLTVLTGISLHGGLAAAWPETSITVSRTRQALVEHWTELGLPGYAQFDNDGRFVGATNTRDAIGPIICTCLEARLSGRIVFVRRTTDAGSAIVLGHTFAVDRHWSHRLVRAEVDLDLGWLRFFALRRRDPTDQPLLRIADYYPPARWFS